jgi:YD repeat-containing protein
LINSTVPSLRGAVISNPSSGTYNLRWKNGTIYQFQAPPTGGRVAYLSSITDPNGNVISVVHGSDPLQIVQIVDPVGRALTLSYDGNDRITSIADPIGRTVRYTYNSQGTLATVTDPEGGVTQYGYDAQNRLTQITDPAAVSRGATTPTVTNHYDQNGRVDQQTLTPDNGTTSQTTTFAYMSLNPWTPAMSPVSQTTVADPNSNVTTYHFNAQGFLIDATDASGQTQVFDREPGTNQLLAIHGTASCGVCGGAGAGDFTFTRDANGNVLTSTDALGYTTQYSYHPTFSNKVTSITDAVGNTSLFTYDPANGNLKSATDPSGATTTFGYDATGLLKSVTDALGNAGTFAYDGVGNLTSITDPLGNVSALAYDGVSRVTTATDPLGRRTQIMYDAIDR